MTKKTLTGGKKSQSSDTQKSFDPDDTNPSSIANTVLEHRALSVREDVKSHVAFSKGVNALLDNKETLDQLLAILVDRKVLSKDDAHLGLSASESHLSMLNKINRYREVILDERILGYLTPGYSVLYQLVSLYEDLENCDGLD
jgi:hypothetical protein